VEERAPVPVRRVPGARQCRLAGSRGGQCRLAGSRGAPMSARRVPGARGGPGSSVPDG